MKPKNNIWVPTISKILFSSYKKEELPTPTLSPNKRKENESKKYNKWDSYYSAPHRLYLKIFHGQYMFSSSKVNFLFFFFFNLYERIALILDFWSSDNDLGKRTSNVTYKSPFLSLWYRGIPSPLNFLTSFGFVTP
jgi:hypothetical protein